MNVDAFPYNGLSIYSNSILLQANSDGFEEFNNVETINNNNITFAYNLHWLGAHIICPDIIGLLSQTFEYPWNGGNYRMNEDGTSSKTEPDMRDEKLIAEDIIKAKVEEKVEIDPFYNLVKDHLKMNAKSGHRYNFMVESPIPGSYFGSN